ncbi:unnamed protein product [Ectocarpus sp. 4 AP-2014]
MFRVTSRANFIVASSFPGISQSAARAASATRNHAWVSGGSTRAPCEMPGNEDLMMRLTRVLARPLATRPGERTGHCSHSTEYRRSTVPH